MDSITQAALGGVVGELVLGRKLGWKGMVWGLFFGTLPDLDIIVYPWLDEVERLKWHRGISHSLLFMIVASFAFAKPLERLHRKKGVSARRAGWFVFLVWSTHVLIDVFTTYGTQIYEPFSDRRVSLNNMAIIDLFFTLPLLFCLMIRPIKGLVYFPKRIIWGRKWSKARADFSESDEIGLSPEMEELVEQKPEIEPTSQRMAKIGISLSCLYVVFSFMMKGWAYSQVSSRIDEEIPGANIVSVSPTFANVILWRALVETEKGYWVTYWSPFDREPGTYDYYGKRHELAEAFEGQELFGALKWFARDHWLARRGPDGKVILVDMRFSERRDPSHDYQMPVFQWHLSYDDEGKMVAPSYRPGRMDYKGALGLVLERLWGNQLRWEEMKPF